MLKILNSIIVVLLFPFSIIYGIGILVRNFLYDKKIFSIKKLNVPVISVGNISVGGTGKTPIVEFIVDFLNSQNKKIAVISRGYKRKSNGEVIVCDGEKILCDVEISGDEAMQVAKKKNVVTIVSENKFEAAKTAVEKFSVDVIVVDDGFQHRKLNRDLDIVLIDVSQFGSNLLPSGRNREFLSSLKRSDIVVLTRCDYNKCKSKVDAKLKIANLIVGTKFVVSKILKYDTSEEYDVSILKNKSVVAFCGIGNPKSFLKILDDLNCVVKEHIIFSDHHKYTESDMTKILNLKNRNKVDYIITTEKDAIKFYANSEFVENLNLYVTKLEIDFINGKKELETKIINTLN